MEEQTTNNKPNPTQEDVMKQIEDLLRSRGMLPEGQHIKISGEPKDTKGYYVCFYNGNSVDLFTRLELISNPNPWRGQDVHKYTSWNIYSGVNTDRIRN